MDYIYWILLIYILLCQYAGYSIYKGYFYYFYSFKNENNEDVHEKYPEYRRTDSSQFTFFRVVILAPLGITRFIIFLCLVSSFALYLK
jgi:hypothetical protein